jgi:hypothetical protein
VVHIALLAESNKQDQQLVLVGTKVVEAILPLFQGHAPSHVSVATHAIIATSVVAPSGYFGAFHWSIMATINAGWVNCTKNARGAHHGSRDYSCHQEVATKKQADLQSKYAGNLAQIMTSKWHKDIWDVSDPSFVIPTHIKSQ